MFLRCEAGGFCFTIAMRSSLTVSVSQKLVVDSDINKPEETWEVAKRGLLENIARWCFNKRICGGIRKAERCLEISTSHRLHVFAIIWKIWIWSLLGKIRRAIHGKKNYFRRSTHMIWERCIVDTHTHRPTLGNRYSRIQTFVSGISLVLLWHVYPQNDAKRAQF